MNMEQHSYFPCQSTIRFKVQWSDNVDIQVRARLVDEFTTEAADMEQQLMDCYLELPTCRNCSFHSGCNPRKAWTLEFQKPKRFAACLSVLQDKNHIQGFLLCKGCQESKSMLGNACDVQFTNIKLLCLWVLKCKQFSNSHCQSVQKFPL